MAGIPLFSCRFARLGFIFLCGAELYFARMGENKLAFFSPKSFV